MWKHSAKRHKLNLGSTNINWSVNGYWFSFSATSETCDVLSFKTTCFFSTTKHVICDSLQQIPFYTTSREITMFHKDFLEFLSRIKTHTIQTSHLILLILTLSIQISMGFKSWQEQENYLFCKTSWQAPLTTQPPTQWKPNFFLWQ